MMRKTGNVMTQIGVEASTDEGLSSLNKQVTVEEVKKAVQLMTENDIVSQGLIIIGTPEDTPESILHKINYMKLLKVDFPIFTMFTPFPGSKVYDKAREDGVIEDDDFDHFDMAYTVMPTRNMSRAELFKWYGECHREHYSDPIQILIGLLSKNRFKRAIWRHMFSYGLRQAVRMYLKKGKYRL